MSCCGKKSGQNELHFCKKGGFYQPGAFYAFGACRQFLFCLTVRLGIGAIIFSNAALGQAQDTPLAKMTMPETCIAGLVTQNVTIDGISDHGDIYLEDGRTVRLAQIGFAKEFGGALKDEFVADIASRPAILYIRKKKLDRWQRISGHIVLGEHDGGGKFTAGLWLEAELVNMGAAYVDIGAQETACVTPLYAAQKRARREKKLFWQRAIISADNENQLRRAAQTSPIAVTGLVRSVGSGRKWMFINFSRNWDTDFTALVAQKDLQEFLQRGVDIENLVGRRVVLYGVISIWNGPAMELTQPNQIEILGPQSAM